MDKQDSNSDKINSFMKTKSPTHLLTLKNNGNFCNKFFQQGMISSVTDNPDYFDEPNNLVYDLSRASSFDAEAFRAIIDLLMQLRAAGNDQNVFIQNNTVVREQILSQLKNEILKVSHRLTSNQIKNLEVISSNSFDEKTLTDILKSLLESSKKKLIGNEPADSDILVKGTSRYITLDKISKSYLTVLEKSLYYEKIVDKILKNISYEKTSSQSESVKLKPDEKSPPLESKVHLKRRSLKELLTKKSQVNISEVLETISKSYDEKVINKMGLTARVIRLGSKISEMNILTKVGSFVEDIIKNSAAKIITSETELINKIVDKSKIDELREDILLNRQQYEEDRAYEQRNISRVYNEVRKLSSAQNLSRSITEVLRTTNIKALNLEENVKKNLLKLTSGKDIINKFKNIYDHVAEKTLISKITEKTELINRQSLKHTDIEEKTAIRDVINLKHLDTFVDKKFIEDVRENNILMRNNRIRQRSYERIHKNAEKLNIDFYEDDNFKSSTSAFSLINLRQFGINDVEDYFFKQKNVFLDHYKRNILAKRYSRITENIENKVKKEIISVNEKEIHEKLKFIFDKQDLSILKHNKIKPLTTTESPDGTKAEVWNKEDIFKFVPVHIKEKILSENEIENIFSKNIIKVLSPQIIKSRNLKLYEKNIYKDFTQKHIHRYTEKSYDLKKEYLINERGTLGRESQYNHISEDYMIYKEIEANQKGQGFAAGSKKSPQTEPEPDIVIKEKETPPKIVDTKAIEKNIMAQTLNKKDIVALIKSYMNGIDVESISQNVIGKVERKLAMDKRRNGIF